MTDLSIDYNGKDIKASYLEWYAKAKTEGFNGIPGWVVKMDDFLDSQLIDPLQNFCALYAFTQKVSSTNRSSMGSDDSESAVKFSKSLIVIPEGKSYTKILEIESRRIRIQELTIRKLKNLNDGVTIQKEFIYYNAYIDHSEVIAGTELALLFSFDRLRVVENIFSEEGKKTGLMAYEVEVYSGKISA